MGAYMTEEFQTQKIAERQSVFVSQGQQVRALHAANGAGVASGTLQSKNVRIHNRRTSIRLEPEMWNALKEIAALEVCTVHDLCGAVHDLKEPGASFTAALRVFLMEYYRSAAKASPQVHSIRQRLKGEKETPDWASAEGTRQTGG